MKGWQLPLALRVTLIYALTGGLWILLSDKLVHFLFPNPEQLSVIQTFKGWFFVAVTALLLFVLLAREALAKKRTERQYTDLFVNAIEGVFRSSPDGRFITVNPAMAKMFGYSSPQEMVSLVKDISAQIYVDKENPHRFIEALLERGVIEKFEFQTLRKDGSVFWTSTNAHISRDDEGNVLYYEGLLTDITKDKVAELALQKAEAHYRMLVEQMPAAVYMDALDQHSTNYFSSPRIFDITGYSPEEWTENPELWGKLIHPEDWQRVMEQNEKSNETHEPFDIEYRMISRSGRLVWVHDTANLICDENGNPLYWQGLLVDVTLQHHAEEAIQASEARYHTLVEQASDAIFISDTQGKYLEVNQRACEILGYSHSELLQLSMQDLLTAEELSLRPLKLHELLQGNRVVSERTLVRKDQTMIPVELSMKMLQDGAFMSIARDITERKLTQETLARSEQRFRSLIEHSMDAIALYSAEGKVLYQSPAATRILGYELGEMLGHNVIEFIHPDDKDRVLDSFQGILQSPGNNLVTEVRCLRKDRAIRWLEVISTNRIDEPGVNAIVANFRDVTENKRVEEALQKQLKELTVLHAVAIAESSSENSDELIQRVTEIIGNTLYPDNCGVLLLNTQGDALQPHYSYRGLMVTSIVTSLPLEFGISGKVVSTKKPIRIGNVRQDPAYYEVTAGICSELCVPIISGEKVLGVLNVESKRPNAFTETDERLLNTIAGGLATALERLRFFQLEQSRRKEAEALHEATSALTLSLELPRLYETILDSVSKLVQYDSASINLEMGGTMEIVAGRGLPGSVVLIGRRYGYDKKWELLMTSRRPLVLADAQENELFEKWPGTEYIRGWIGVPLIAHDKFIGLLSLDSYQVGAFSEEHAILLQTFANQAAVAIENGRLFQTQLRRRQQADALREATTALTASAELPELFNIILKTLVKLVPCTSASVELTDGDQLEVVAQRGLQQGNELVGFRYPHDLEKWGLKYWEPIVIADIQADDRFTKFSGSDCIRGWMGVPLIAQDRAVGYLNLHSDQVGYFTDEHGALVQTFANQAAVAIEKARTLHEERRRTRIIEALADIANEISTTGEINSLLENVASRALDLLKASHVAIYLLQDDNVTIKPVTAQGTFSHEILSHILRVGEGITGNIIGTGKSEIINDTTSDPRRIRVPGTSDEDGLRETMMSSALILRGKPIGAINAWRLRSDGLFNESELNFLISIAHQTSISIEAGRLLQETSRRAQETAAIAEVGRDISSTLQLDAVLERIGGYAKDLLRAETSAVYLLENGNESLRAIAAFGDDAEELKNFSLKLGKGIVGNIAVNKIGEIVNETTKDPRGVVVDGTQTDPHEHIMAVPVLNQGELTGLLAVWRTGEDQQFIPRELEFLSSLAQQAAVAIENARLFQAEQQRREEAENLQIAATALTSTLEPGQVLETILVALQQVVPYHSAAIFQLEGEHVRVTAAKGFPDNESIINKLFPANNQLFLDINKDGKVIILEDSYASPYFERWAAEETVHGWMGVPLIARGQVIGYITIDSLAIGAFDKKDALLAQTFAHQAAAALENARLFNETRQRVEELEIVSRVSVALRVAQDSQEILFVLLDEIKASMDTDSAGIWLYDADKAELILKAANGRLIDLPSPNFKPGEGIVGSVFASGKFHVSEAFSRDPEINPEHVETFGTDAGGIFEPIRTSSETIGVLVVTTLNSRQLGLHHIRLLKTIAEIAGNAISRSHLYEKSEEQVRRLTTLREIDTAISSSFDLRVTLDLLTEHLLSKMGVSAAAVLLLHPESQMLSYHSGTGFRDPDFLRATLHNADSLATQILVSQKEIYIQNLETYAKSSRTAMTTKEGFISYYGIPLQSKGLIRGVLETYFRQPFTPNAEWYDFVHTLAGQATIAIDNTRLFENLQRSNQELSLAYDTTLEGWSKALELRDKETEGHTRRVTDLTLELARQMGIPDSQLTQMRRGVLVHDIGKMGVPDNILRKEGPLTPEEWVEMRKHPQYAFDLLYPIHYLRPALDIAYYHHEWWDGSGYPSGLKGKNIPLSARIFAVVDVWDALLSDRPYRMAWSKPKVMQYIRRLSGTQFDPEVVDVFLRMMKDRPVKPVRKPRSGKPTRKPSEAPPKPESEKGQK